MHRPFADDADLYTIAKRIVTICGILVRLMPGDEVGIGTPIGFFSVEASSYLWIRFFAGAKIDVRAFDWLDISKLLTACISEAGETDQQRRDCLVEKISHGVLPSVSC